MGNKILKALSKNLGFKILSILFAFTLWVTVYNLDDPTKTKSLTVNVTVTNREVLDDMGKYYEIVDGMNKVSFSVTAPRSVLDKLDETDFVAEANLQKLSMDESGFIGSVPVEIFCTANTSGGSVKISSSNKSINLSLEDMMSKQFVVQANAVGTVKDGYALGGVEVTAPNVLKVSGPKSIVSRVSAVVATIDVNGMSDTLTSYRATPILMDENGSEIDTTRLTLSDTTVNVQAEILNVKEVPLSITPSGKVADGYVMTAISSNPTTILLKGNKSILNSINSIQIPSDVVSVEGAEKDVTATIDVSEYIPGGVEMAVSEQAMVEITISVGKVKTKAYTINTEDIVVIGLGTHHSLEYDLSSLAVHITGLESDINVLKEEMLVGSIDVTELDVGIYRVELVLDLDENKYSHNKVKVKVKITDVAGVETGSTTTENEDDNARNNE